MELNYTYELIYFESERVVSSTKQLTRMFNFFLWL